MVVLVRCMFKVKKNKCCMYKGLIILGLSCDSEIGEYCMLYCILLDGIYKGCIIIEK